jgi:hypothetical protein
MPLETVDGSALRATMKELSAKAESLRRLL